jgi:periplasmic protein TonB
VPKDVAIITEEALPPPTTAGVAGGIGSALTNAGSLLGGIIGGAPVAAAPPPQAKKQEVVRQKIGGNVIMANLINKVPPVYPPLAKQARIQGQVKLKAIISTSGTIQQLELISGHPLLVPAAMAAVRQWTYKPTLLNGEPVEVETQVDVNFALN